MVTHSPADIHYSKMLRIEETGDFRSACILHQLSKGAGRTRQHIRLYGQLVDFASSDGSSNDHCLNLNSELETMGSKILIILSMHINTHLRDRNSTGCDMQVICTSHYNILNLHTQLEFNRTNTTA